MSRDADIDVVREALSWHHGVECAHCSDGKAALGRIETRLDHQQALLESHRNVLRAIDGHATGPEQQEEA